MRSMTVHANHISLTCSPLFASTAPDHNSFVVTSSHNPTSRLRTPPRRCLHRELRSFTREVAHKESGRSCVAHHHAGELNCKLWRQANTLKGSAAALAWCRHGAILVPPQHSRWTARYISE